MVEVGIPATGRAGGPAILEAGAGYRISPDARKWDRFLLPGSRSYSRTRVSSTATLPPFSTLITLCNGWKPVRVMSTT